MYRRSIATDATAAVSTFYAPPSLPGRRKGSDKKDSGMRAVTGANSMVALRTGVSRYSAPFEMPEPYSHGTFDL